jgi:hypothetical protein
MPLPFRIHQTRTRPERILVKLVQGRYIIPHYVAPTVVPEVTPNVVVPAAKQKSIKLSDIKKIIQLLQNSEHKNLTQLLPNDLKTLLSVSHEEMDTVEDEEDTEVDVAEEDDDDDVLIIDV